LKDRTGGLLALADEDDLRIKIRRQVAALQSDGVDVELVMRRTHDTRQQRSPRSPRRSKRTSSSAEPAGSAPSPACPLDADVRRLSIK